MLETTGGINTVNAYGAYPGMGGESIAQQASAFTDYSAAAPTNEMGPMAVMGGDMPMAAPAAGAAAGAAMAATGSSPAKWWATLAIMLFVLMWLAEHFGSEGSNFSNVRLSIYNIIVLTLAVVLGMTLLKAAASKFPNNAGSQLIMAA